MNKIRYTTSTLALLTGCVIMMTGNAFAMPQDELPARKSIQYNGGQFTCQVDKTFNEAAGKMKSIGGTWAIVTSEGGRVLAIDVKDAFKVDGLDVIFSGYRGTPPPNVRLIASPFELVSIRKKGDPRPKVDKPKQVLPANLPKNPDEMIKMLANRKNAKVAVAAIDQHCRKDKSSRDQMIKQLLNVTRSDNGHSRGWRTENVGSHLGWRCPRFRQRQVSRHS